VVTVKLKCGVHAESESDTRPIFVCHHCGMPVCEEHGWVVVADDAFDPEEEPVPRSAMHCPECITEYHPRGASKRRGWTVSRPRAAADLAARVIAQPGPQQQPGSQQQPGPQQQPTSQEWSPREPGQERDRSGQP
jgi:hypothetical protein